MMQDRYRDKAAGMSPFNRIGDYEIHGSGRALVLLHGGGSTIQSTFGRILPELAKAHQVIAVELQAHGHTKDIDRPLSFEQDAFHLVTDGIHAALQRAREAANGLDVRLGGGAATIRQYLQAGLIDQLHFAISPIILGSGESLLAGIDLLKLGYKCTEHATSPAALHVVLTK